MREASPFVVGAKVGVIDPKAFGNIREDEVAKVYKTGNFVLVGEPGVQWRDFGGGDHPWEARRAGERMSAWSKPSRCFPWTADVEEKRARIAERNERQRRWGDALYALEKLRHKTPPTSFLDKIEGALSDLELSTPSLPLQREEGENHG